MSECWINVYPKRRGEHWIGLIRSASREDAEKAAAESVAFIGIKPIYRLHITLKPIA